MQPSSQEQISKIAKFFSIKEEYIKQTYEDLILGNSNKFLISNARINTSDTSIFDTYEIDFENCHFCSDLNFSIDIIECKNLSIKGITFHNCYFDSRIMFENSVYSVFFSFKQCNFHKGITINSCTFKCSFFICNSIMIDSLSIKNSYFTKIADFTNIQTLSADFSRNNFAENIYFNNSHFKQEVDFHESTFEKTACFYGARFKKIPNFSQVIFKENLNFVNTKLDFNYADLKRDIEKSQQHLGKKPNNEKANDFRDSFRLIKNALIKGNNLLDASSYYKNELYCKEIELDSKNPKPFSKEWIDKWQLFIYRNLCDHHTDRLKSLNSLVIVIGIFTLFSLYAMFWVGTIYNLIPSDNFPTNFLNLPKLYAIHIKDLTQQSPVFFAVMNFCLTVLFILLFLFTLMHKAVRNIIIALSYTFVVILLIFSPKYLIPAISIFTDKREILDSLSTIGAIYTILFALVLYSFIKSIRKSSIVPS